VDIGLAKLAHARKPISAETNPATCIKLPQKSSIIVSRTPKLSPLTTALRFPVGSLLDRILFASATFGEAITKLESVQHRAEDFVSAVSVALRRNSRLAADVETPDSFENSNSTLT
jgi:hypothetical protein